MSDQQDRYGRGIELPQDMGGVSAQPPVQRAPAGHPGASAMPYPGVGPGFRPVRPMGVYGRRVLWPAVLGVVSVVMAASNALSAIGVVVSTVISFFTHMGGGSFRFDDVAPLVAMGSRLLSGVLAGALLLPAGVLMWRQSRASVSMSIAWAITDIFLTILWPIAQFFSYPASYRMQLVFWPVWSASMGLIYPVFLLAWLSRSKARDEIRLW